MDDEGKLVNESHRDEDVMSFLSEIASTAPSFSERNLGNLDEYNKKQSPSIGKFLDFRENIRPKIDYRFDTTFSPAPYYQVFAQRHGFLPNLSIVDLLFNMGPESRIVLRNSIV